MLRTFVVMGLILGLVTGVFANRLVDARAVGSTLIVNEVEIMTVRTSQGTTDAVSRAQSAAHVLVVSGEGVRITAENRDREWMVMAGTRRILTITRSEADAQRSTPEAFARLVAQRLNEALALPQIFIDPVALQVPIDGQTTFKVRGGRARNAQVSVSGNSVRLVAGEEVGTRRAIAQQLGRTTVTLTSGTFTQVVTIDVLDYAARIPQAVSASVFGRPPRPEVIESAIKAAIRRTGEFAPGAEIVTRLANVDIAPTLNSMVQVPVDVRVTAPGHFPIMRSVTATVSNLGINLDREAELWYSNDPENVRGYEPLFKAHLRAARPARLLYHHMNAGTSPIAISFRLINPHPQPVRVVITYGDGEPSLNPTLVGYQAGDIFLNNWLANSAEVLVVPANSELPIALRRLTPRVTMSGLVSLRILDTHVGDLLFVGESIPPNTLTSYEQTALNQPAPWTQVAPTPIRTNTDRPTSDRLIFPEPFMGQEFRYEAGGRFVFLRFGQNPIANILGDEPLLGNFGVIYRMQGDMINPTDRPHDVEVVYEASAGYGGAIILFNGEMIRTGLLQPKGQFTIKQVRLMPGERINLDIVTIPLSGASYPVTIIIRPKGED